MARIIVMILLSILCVAVIAFGIYDVFFQGNDSFSSIFRILIIMAGLAISWAKLFVRGGQRGARNLEFYRKSYADLVDNTFAKDEKSFKQLLKSIKYFNENKHKKALSILDELWRKCRTGRETTAVLVLSALIKEDMGDIGGAVADYEKLLRFDGTCARAWSNLGLIYSNNGDYQKAIECYKSAIEHEPNDAIYQNNMANAYFRMGEYNLAIEHAEKSLAANGKTYQAATLLSMIYATLGDEELCKKYFTVAVTNGQDPERLRVAIEKQRAVREVSVT